MSDLKKAAEAALAWLDDPKLGTWRYTESGHMYRDIDELRETLRAALAQGDSVSPSVCMPGGTSHADDSATGQDRNRHAAKEK